MFSYYPMENVDQIWRLVIRNDPDTLSHVTIKIKLLYYDIKFPWHHCVTCLWIRTRADTTATSQTAAKLSTKPRLVFDMTSQEKLSDVEGVYDGEDVDVHVTSQTISASHRGHHLDMVDRDPTKMNDHVRVFYQDVFAEPDGSHSIDGVWGASFFTFVSTKYWCYRILTAIFGVPTAILCGCYFACLSFDYIWCIMPCLRGYLIQLQCMGKVFGLFVRTFFDPFFDSLGRVFGGIKLTKVKMQEGGTFNA